MIKINYPSNADLISFENEYYTLFSKQESEFNNRLKNTNLHELFKDSSNETISYKDIIVGDIEKLNRLYQKYKNDYQLYYESYSKYLRENKNNRKTYKLALPQDEQDKINEIEKLIPFFSYQQQKISTFFKKHNHIFNLCACHYCNMDSVHVYSHFGEYSDSLDALNKATKTELLRYGVDEQDVELVITGRNNGKYIKGKLSQNINNIYKKLKEINRGLKDHYTLDHYIPQSECFFLPRSLYNFVPACYTCNSKLKKTLLCGTITDLHKFSPTYERYDNHEIRFSLLIKKGINIFDYELETKRTKFLSNFTINVDVTDNNNKSAEVFNLQQRYVLHKNKAVRLAYLQERYSDKTIEEIANILSREKQNSSKNAVTNESIKQAIFNIPELSNESFSKLLNDIDKQLRYKTRKNTSEK